MSFIGFSGCTSQPAIQIDLAAYTPSTKTQQSGTGQCGIRISGVTDQRLHSETIGLVWEKPVLASKPADWLHRRLTKIENRYVAEPGRKNIVLTVLLRNMYIHNMLGNTAANILLEIQFEISGGEAFIRHYRGSSTSINWWRTEQEYRAELDKALDNAVTKIRADLQKFCDPGSQDSLAGQAWIMVKNRPG